MKKYLIPIILLLSIAVLFAGKPLRSFRILYLNPNSITIGNKVCAIDSTYSESDEILWSSPKQVMKVRDTKSGESYVLSATQTTNDGHTTMKSFFYRQKKLGARSGVAHTLEDLSRAIPKELIVDSVLDLASDIQQDETRFFYISMNYANEVINKKITPVSGFVRFCTEELFTIDGRQVPPERVIASLYYYDSSSETSICVADGFELIPIP